MFHCCISSDSGGGGMSGSGSNSNSGSISTAIFISENNRKTIKCIKILYNAEYF